MDAARILQLVDPFYLRMMRTNVVLHADGLLAEVDAAGRTVTTNEVVELLGKFWRERVMGAWFSLCCEGTAEVLPAVLQALATSQGSLDAPPLVVAAVLLGGPESIPTLNLYAERDVAAQWGACGFASAAIDSLGGSSAACSASGRDRMDFTNLLEFGRRVRSAQGGV